MEQYISKSALVTEIERLKSEALQKKDQCKSKGLSKIMHQIGAYNKVLSFLDTLKTKESEEEKVPTWKKVGPDVGQTILYMDGAESYLERFGYRISLNELDKLPKENNL